MSAQYQIEKASEQIVNITPEFYISQGARGFTVTSKKYRPTPKSPFWAETAETVEAAMSEMARVASFVLFKGSEELTNREWATINNILVEAGSW